MHVQGARTHKDNLDVNIFKKEHYSIRKNIDRKNWPNNK